MRYVKLCIAVGLILAVSGTAGANTVESSTLWFQGALTEGPTGVYTGAINATAGYYYVDGGGGAGISTAGGFDVYAKEGGTAYVEGMTPDNWTIGSDHDAYSQSGPWGTWYDPDCADWNQYSLELTADHWYLRYASTWESPMSGAMNWTNMIASETDLGTQERPQTGPFYGYPGLPAALHNRTDSSANYGGGAGAWDWQNGWGVEVVPLQYSDFAVAITDLGEGLYEVSLTPVPEPLTMLGVFAGIAGIGAYIRKRRKA